MTTLTVIRFGYDVDLCWLSPRQEGARCSWCGRSPVHDKAHCPAKDAICHSCSKRGHFSSVCRSKSAIDNVSEQEEDIAFLDTVVSKSKSQPWAVKLKLNEILHEFKIDTGADVTVIPKHSYNQTRDGILSQPSKMLRGPAQNKLKVLWSIHRKAEK